MAWQVGDLAVCTRSAEDWVDGNSLRPSGGPDVGWVGTVCRIRVVKSFTFLVFDGWCSRGLSSTGFKKISPDKHEACEPEFVTLLKRTRVSA